MPPDWTEVLLYGATGRSRDRARNEYLRGNYAPVGSEVTGDRLEVVEGEIPEGLDGAFLRVGPNPYFEPVGNYHWFDGDGMVHAVRIHKGAASYANR